MTASQLQRAEDRAERLYIGCLNLLHRHAATSHAEGYLRTEAEREQAEDYFATESLRAKRALRNWLEIARRDAIARRRHARGDGSSIEDYFHLIRVAPALAVLARGRESHGRRRASPASRGSSRGDNSPGEPEPGPRPPASPKTSGSADASASYNHARRRGRKESI